MPSYAFIDSGGNFYTYAGDDDFNLTLSNSSFGNSSGGGSVNVNAQYTWTNTQTFTNNITFGNSTVYTQANSIQFEVIDTINQFYINSSMNYIANSSGSSSLSAFDLTFGSYGGIGWYGFPSNFYMGMFPTFASIDGASDYNIYFGQLGGTNRGFVFMADLYANGSQFPVAQIDSTGSFYTQGGIVLANSWGTIGQVLTSNGPHNNAYWSTVSGGGSVNVNAQYTWTNTQTFTNAITFDTTAQSYQAVVTTHTANYTLANSDSGSVILATNASAMTITIPNNLTPSSRVLITRMGSGTVTIANASSIVLKSRNSNYAVANQYGTASILMANSTYAIIDGNI